MKSKKILAVAVVTAMLVSALSACSSAPTESEVPSATQVVTQKVTDAQGELVTDSNGEAVTELVTDKNGDTVTEVVSTTQPQSTTTNSTTKQGNKIENSTTKKQTTTKKSGNSAQKPSSKQTTTEAADNSISIVLLKNMKAQCKSPNVSIAEPDSEKGCVIVIDKPGDYVITQNTGNASWHGQIIVKLKNTQKASLRFENVHISNKTKNIIQLLDSSIKSSRSFLEAEASAGTEADDAIATVADNDKAPNISISFPTGTSSTFETSANAYTGVIYNESKLTIKGNGSATITSKVNANNCICSTKSITIKNVGLTLNTAQNTNPDSLADTTGSAKGIFSYSKVTVESGFLTIKSNGDAIRCDRFYMNGGTANLISSACDGVDADDSIEINGGEITSTALEKYCFKVRRVNNTEKGSAKGTVRAGKNDCFHINGGKVRGEGKKITSLDKNYQSDKIDSKQANVTGKIIKKSAGSADAGGESKVPAIITIGKWSSMKACTKFLYSGSDVKKGTAYTASAKNNAEEVKVEWTGNSGVALIRNSVNK